MRNQNQDLLIPPADEIASVSEFTKKVKYLLETEIGGAWIRGEVSNLRRQSSGHVYFSLKDEGSQVTSVMFRNDAYKQSVDLEDGMQVIVFGQVSVYEPRGNYQLIVRLVVMDGLGRLQQVFEKLKARLQEEGLFDEESKKKIPSFPRAVGIITSPTGAAVQDFIRILKRREWVGHVIVLPVKVQGEGSASEIASMIDFAQKLSGLELLVVGRGGGSLEDLWAFNEETVVRAIHRSAIPIISAVGHEIDFTLSEYKFNKEEINSISSLTSLGLSIASNELLFCVKSPSIIYKICFFEKFCNFVDGFEFALHFEFKNGCPCELFGDRTEREHGLGRV